MDQPRRTPALLLLALAVAVLAAVALPASGYLVGSRHRSDPVVRTFLTPGYGEVTAVPDELSFELTVSQHSSDSVEAMNHANTTLTSVRKALLDAGVAAKDIRTTTVNIRPTFRYQKGGAVPTGFSASEGIRVLVRALPKAGAVLGAAATALEGHGRIGGVSMEISDRSDLLQQARATAVADARHAAEAYARAAKVSLGAVESVEEASDSGADKASFGAFAGDGAGSAAAAVPIQPGEQTVAVHVKVRWGLGD